VPALPASAVFHFWATPQGLFQASRNVSHPSAFNECAHAPCPSETTMQALIIVGLLLLMVGVLGAMLLV